MTAPARTLTVADFVLARIAEDEAAALAATPGPWRRVSSEWGNGSKAAHVSEVDYRFCLVVTHTTNDSALDTADHIATHDPARVLAQCEALRAVVEQCRPRYVVMYRESERLLADAFDQQNVQTIAHSGPVWPFDGAEDTLRALASTWRSHPAFDPSWAAS